MHCDPSFVTMVANGLEKRGLARRETSEHDRRIKVMKLTDEGVSMRERLEKEFSTRMPWATALDVRERECLLTILRKLAAATDPDAAAPMEEAHQQEAGSARAGGPATTGGDPGPN